MSELARGNPRFTYVSTMSEMEKSHRPWEGEQGRIDRKMLKTYLAGIDSAIYYITGPPDMVIGLQKLLKSTKVHDVDVRTEEFTGY
jgi:Na+-transporting NADH:ubiquinone oxidoreductase subunit NqrF